MIFVTGSTIEKNKGLHRESCFHLGRKKDSVTDSLLVVTRKLPRPRLAVSHACETSLRLSHPPRTPSSWRAPVLVRFALCGKGGIRTPGTISRTLAFQASTLNHSATFPDYSTLF